MKKYITKAMAILAVIAMVACTEDTIVEGTQSFNDSEFVQKISITGKDFQFDGETRSSVTISGYR